MTSWPKGTKFQLRDGYVIQLLAWTSATDCLAKVKMFNADGTVKLKSGNTMVKNFRNLQPMTP